MARHSAADTPTAHDLPPTRRDARLTAAGFAEPDAGDPSRSGGRHAALPAFLTGPVPTVTAAVGPRRAARPFLDDVPVTDPHLFDAPLPVARRVGGTDRLVSAALPVADLAPYDVPGAPGPRSAARAAVRGELPPTGRPADLAPHLGGFSPLAFPSATITDVAHRPDAPGTEDLDGAGRPSRAIGVAVAAVAMLGAVSGAAVLLPGERPLALALTDEQGAITAPTPTIHRTPALRAVHRQHGRATATSSRSPLATTATALAPASLRARTTRAAASAAPSATASPSATATATATHQAPAPTTTSSLASALAADTSGIRRLGAGIFTFSDFGSDLIGAHLPSAGLQGRGVGSTILEMGAHTSTKASRVPTASGTTNQLSLVKITGGSPKLSGFTLQGTAQGHLYNGLRINSATNAQVSDVRVKSVPGDADNPPGETFGINDFHTDGSHYSHVEIDGAGVGGADFGANSSKNLTITDSDFHDSGHSHGATFWQTKNITITNTRAIDNDRVGFNFERVSGTVTLTDDTMRGNTLADIRFGSDQGSAKVTIVDPVFSGAKLRIMLTPKYMGTTNTQKKSDIHVMVNGVDRTSDLVEWVTHF